MRLRPFATRDAPAAAALAAGRGFATDPREWLLAASLGPGLCAVAPDGALAGVALGCRLGGRLAGVAALVVAPAHAGHGLGRRLADGLAAACPGSALLAHAPPASVPALLRAGFRAAGAVVRHGGALADAAPTAGGAAIRLRPLGGPDLPAVVALDALACGAPRRALLERLLPLADRVGVAIEGGRVVGYGVAWPRGPGAGEGAAPGEIALGPVVAEAPAAAVALAAFLAGRHAAPVRLWAPEGGTLSRWAAGSGLPADGGAVALVRGGELPAPGRARAEALLAPGLG